jgi:hypothetical protein
LPYAGPQIGLQNIINHSIIFTQLQINKIQTFQAAELSHFLCVGLIAKSVDNELYFKTGNSKTTVYK